MILTEPKPFVEAIQSREIRSILPTELRTDMLSTLPEQLRARSVFSAAVMQAETLQHGDDLIRKIAAGKMDRATARTSLRQFAIANGYQPPQGEAGTIADFRTEGRLNLFLDMNVQEMHEAGRYIQGQDPAILDQWPCVELVRERDSKVPRLDWPDRFRQACIDAGDELALAAFERTGRMVARKDSRVWIELSRFQRPYPPFDFGSGMGFADIDRDESIDLGLIDRDTQIRPDDRDLNQDLQATPEVRDASLKTELEQQLSGIAQFIDGVLRLITQ